MFLHLTQTALGPPNTLRSQRLLQDRMATSMERLGSGLRLNRASDGPAALVASDFLRSRVRGLEQANENLQFGSNLISTAEGGLQEVSTLLVKLRELAVEAANLPDTPETEVLQEEADRILDAIDRIGATTRYGREQLLTGDFRRTATVFPASSAGNLGAVSVDVPDFSTIPLGRHQLEINNAGGSVTGFDDSRATTGEGEFGRVTDGATFNTPILAAGAVDRIIFGSIANFFVSEAGGLDENPPLNDLTLGFTNETEPRMGPDQATFLFEADSGANRGIFRTTFAGAVTQLGGGFNDLDFDVTEPGLFPATQQMAFVADSTFSVGPAFDDLDAMAFATIGGVDTVFTVDDDAGAGGGPALQAFDTIGRPIGLPIDLTPIFGAGGAVDGLTFDGVNLVGLDATNRMVHTFTTGGALVGSFALNTVTLGENYAGVVTTGVANSVAQTAIPTVVNAAGVLAPENLTLTFTEDAGGGITFRIDGSETGNLVAPGTAFGSGVPITVDGIQFTLTANQGASRSTAVGAATLVNDVNDRLDVSLDGGATFRTVDLTAGGPVAGGAAIAAVLQVQLNAAFGAGQVQADYHAGSDRIVLTNLVGGTVTVQDAAGPSVSGLFNDAGLTITDGVNDVLNVSLDGAPAVDVDLLAGGAAVGGAAIAAAMQLAFDGAFGAGTTRVVFDDGGDGAGNGNERFLIFSEGVNGANDARVSIGAAAGNDAAPTLLLGVANGGTEADDAAAANVGLGVANGGFEGLGANVLTGDTFVVDVTEAGTAASGIAFNSVTGRLHVGDAATGFIHEYQTNGVQRDGGLDFGSLGFGGLLRLEHDPTTATGSFFVVDNAGNVVEIDDTPAVGPDNVTATFVRSFAQPGTVRGIARSTNPNFGLGGSNLFLGNDAGAEVRQFALRPATGNYEDTVRNVYRQDLTTLAINQLSGEAGTQADPEISENGTVVAYLNEGGTELVTRTLAGGARTVQVLGVAATSIEAVSATGRFVAFQTAGGGSVIDMTTGLVLATGANQQFHPTLDRVFYESGGEILLMDFPAGTTTQISGSGGRPSGSTDFDLSPDGASIAYRSNATGDAFVAPSGGVGAAVRLTNLVAGDPLNNASQLRFSEDSLRVAMVDAGDVFVRNADGTMIPVVETGGAFVAGPTGLPGNTLVGETFTITIIADNDLGSPPVGTGDLFSVTGSITGAQGTGRVGEAYVSPGNGLGLGAGLSFTLRESGQYAVGTTFTVSTGAMLGVRLDGGPEFMAFTGENELAFTPDGGALSIEFGGVAPLAGTTIFQEILIEPGAIIQSAAEAGRPDELPYSIDALTQQSLGLDGLDLREFLPRIGSVENASAGLSIPSGPRIVDPNDRTPAETLQIEFVSATTFSVTGSVSGAISRNNTYVPGTPIVLGNVEVTLAGAAAPGDEIRIEVRSAGAAIDQAIDRVNALRSHLGSTVQEIESKGRSNSVAIEELRKATSELRDVDVALETASLTRDQLLFQTSIGLQAQIGANRESLLAVVRDVIEGAPGGVR